MVVVVLVVVFVVVVVACLGVVVVVVVVVGITIIMIAMTLSILHADMHYYKMQPVPCLHDYMTQFWGEAVCVLIPPHPPPSCYY